MTPEQEDPEMNLEVRIATSNDDRPEFERIRKGITKALQKYGGYLPEIDNILVDQIASSTIYWKKIEKFLDAETASEFTYARVADSKSKFLAMIEINLHELALNRRDRIGQDGEADLMRKLREEIMKRIEK